MSEVATTSRFSRLLTEPKLIRERTGQVFRHLEDGRSRWFTVDLGRLEEAAALVVETIQERYPSLDIPFHSRWRHLDAGGRNRWGPIAEAAGKVGSAERARTAFDLVIVSVLLDAGAGAAWSFAEPPGPVRFSRSEGLAVASVHLFSSGALSGRPEEPLRADANGLARLSAAALAAAFQVAADNPLEGPVGRASLLNALGRVVDSRPDVFGAEARLGGLFDHLAGQARGGELPASAILVALLDVLGPMWPGRLQRDGIALGDTWEHRAAEDGLVSFHKLSQWLAYSLVEPLEEAGMRVVGLEALTGLAEYRNGGLFLDTGVLRLRDAGLAETALRPEHEAVVEWRAATVVLLDRVAALVRSDLGRDEASLPLLRILEGGTWAAGRRIAARLRPGGVPPLAIVSDGTVF